MLLLFAKLYQYEFIVMAKGKHKSIDGFKQKVSKTWYEKWHLYAKLYIYAYVLLYVNEK